MGCLTESIRLGDVVGRLQRNESVRKLVVVSALALVATACSGGGPTSSAPTPSKPGSMRTSTQHAQARSPVRLVRGFGDEVGLSARFPLAWYAQPYGATTLLITSFPVHVDDGRVWQAIPPGGTAIQIYDEPSGSITACKRLGGAYGHVPLGRYGPNYEGIGAAFRSQFHDRGHTVLVFTSFGGIPPTVAQRLLAERILASIHVEPGACPVKTILALGQRAVRLNRVLTQAARSQSAASRTRRGAYTPKLSTTSGPAGTAVAITGAIPPTGENGQPVHLARLVVWWNLDLRYPSPAVRFRTSARPGRLIKLTLVPLIRSQSRYRATFTVPKTHPGSYPVVVLQAAKDGSVAQLGAASFTVTTTQ
jgi:hypothetical protein